MNTLISGNSPAAVQDIVARIIFSCLKWCLFITNLSITEADRVCRLLADSSWILELKNPGPLDMVVIKSFCYLALHSPCFLFYIICNFWSYVLLVYIIFISKVSLWLHLLPLPLGCLQPGYSCSQFAWETTKADTSARSLQSWEKASSSALGDKQWEYSVASIFSPILVLAT